MAERNGNLIPWAVTILAINLKIGNQAYNQSPESMLSRPLKEGWSALRVLAKTKIQIPIIQGPDPQL